MNGTTLRETLQSILPESKIKSAASHFDVIKRERKLDIVTLVQSLVLSAGSDDGGTLADSMRRYRSEAEQKVVRGAFYDWMDEDMAMMMEFLLGEAINYATSQPTYLPGILGTVEDWLCFDSETVTLRPKLATVYPGSGSPAAVKVHKEFSLGRFCTSVCHFSPAREHDGPHLDVDERYRNKGLLVDLGYASLDFIRDCEKYNVKYVIRLKNNWKPRVVRITRGQVNCDFFAGTDLDALLAEEVIALDGRCIDADVTIGRGKKAVTARLVMIPGPEHYLIYLTNLPRRTHGPRQIGDLYRVRWEIESDNKLDKSGARLDQIRATTESSVRILLCAALLHSLIVDVLIQKSRLDRARRKARRQAPLHRLALAYALRTRHALLLAALSNSATSPERWNHLAELIAEEGSDPNWRRRPSILDILLGMTAPRGRPRRKKLWDCAPSAAPYRTVRRQLVAN